MMKQKIQHSAKVGMKKKIELVEAKPNKVNGVNAVSKKKVPLKAEIMIQMKELQERFDSLQKENKENIESLKEANKALEKYVEVIKNLKQRVHLEEVKKMQTQETQTETGMHLKCNECNFEASNNS